ncbi:MAG: hypothetical protein PHI97_34125, partial [Desulfobulbus sp.]|nr:hypothetical protein [Desulfobulbus sp.]
PPHRLIQSLGTKKLFSIEDHRACPTNGSDFGSLRSQNLTLFVIHNSNYGSKKEMEAAVSRHFEERNLYYKNNPKRAGNKIWDREAFDLDKLPGGLFRTM